jgi:MATE family multidrug resistance protein
MLSTVTSSCLTDSHSPGHAITCPCIATIQDTSCSRTLIWLALTTPSVLLSCFSSVAQSHALLLQLGQQPDIAALASRYLILCIPCLFLTTTMECIRKYLQSQRAVKPAMAVSAAVLLASPLFFWLLVEKCQLGLDGAALAFIACQVTTLLGLLGYVMYRAWRLQGKREQTWGGWSGEAFQGWGEYCSYGLPAAAMIAGEWWAYEVSLQQGSSAPVVMLCVVMGGGRSFAFTLIPSYTVELQGCLTGT